MAYHEKVKQLAIELYQGCSATEALKLLKKKFPEANDLNERTIRRWRNKKLLDEHYEQMAEVARTLISDFGEVYKNTPRGDKFDILEYSYTVNGNGQGVTREWLGSKLAAYIEPKIERCPDIDWKSFSPHIIVEFPEVKRIGLVWFATTNPHELLQTLKRLATEKSFKGKCPVCEHLR